MTSKNARRRARSRQARVTQRPTTPDATIEAEPAPVATVADGLDEWLVPQRLPWLTAS